jgi:uncharacterized protein (DUF1697 family)
MSHVVFLRAANVGGRNVFRPAQLALALKHLDVVNVGAAGTFVVRARATPAKIESELLARLPFAPPLAIVPARNVVDLVRSQPFAGVKLSPKLRGWAAALCGRPTLRPTLPLSVPAGKAWSVRLDRVAGIFALGLFQRRPGGFVFPSVIVEKALGAKATTRWWETLERVARIAQS